MSATGLEARYAAPTATVALDTAAGPAAGLKRRSVLLMVVFSVLTLGLYPVFWLMRRRRALNALDSSRKLSPWPPRLVLIAIPVQVVIAVAIGPHPANEAQIAEGLLTLIRFGLGLALLLQFFAVRQILEDHMAPPRTAGDVAIGEHSLSGVMTFFFTVYYLQFIINRDIVAARR